MSKSGYSIQVTQRDVPIIVNGFPTRYVKFFVAEVRDNESGGRVVFESQPHYSNTAARDDAEDWMERNVIGLG